MATVKILLNLKRNGIYHKAGEIKNIDNEETLAELQALGVVEVIDGAASVTPEAPAPVTPAQESTQTEETVTPAPLEEQPSESVSQAPSQPSEPSSDDDEPSPEQIAQDVADI